MTCISKADTHNGVMVALFPSRQVADLLAQPGGEPAQDLHVTLAYLGPADQLTPDAGDRLKQTVAEFAARTPPIVATVSGTGLFTAGPEPVTYASVDASGLAELRTSLVEQISWEDDLQPSQEHGFTPHMTLAYDARTVQVPNTQLNFAAITVCIGDDRVEFPLYGVRKAEVEIDIPIWKAAIVVPPPGTPLTVYGVVMHPYGPDSQGDETPAEEIEKAAHRWMIDARAHDVQHDGVVLDAAPVQSFIAPMDLVFKADDGAEQTVLKGSWVVGVAVHDQQLKADIIAKRITGFSIGGSAIRTAAVV
jgi:2'-5' RNA ligase